MSVQKIRRAWDIGGAFPPTWDKIPASVIHIIAGFSVSQDEDKENDDDDDTSPTFRRPSMSHCHEALAAKKTSAVASQVVQDSKKLSVLYVVMEMSPHHGLHGIYDTLDEAALCLWTQTNNQNDDPDDNIASVLTTGEPRGPLPTSSEKFKGLIMEWALNTSSYESGAGRTRTTAYTFLERRFVRYQILGHSFEYPVPLRCSLAQFIRVGQNAVSDMIAPATSATASTVAKSTAMPMMHAPTATAPASAVNLPPNSALSSPRAHSMILHPTRHSAESCYILPDANFVYTGRYTFR